MTLSLITKSPEDTLALGGAIGRSCFGSMIILLNGDLGCGKTLLTKGIAEGLGIDEMVNSPTYTIVQCYVGRLSLNHFDLYRLTSEDDFYDIGGYEYMTDSAVCVFEWPDIIHWQEYDSLTIDIEYIDDSTRRIILSPFGDKYQVWLDDLREHICHLIE